MEKPKLYDLNQCALYKLGSKARLASILHSSIGQLTALAARKDNYRIFLLPESVCPFTGKKVKERPVQEPKPELRRIHDRLRKLLSRVKPPGYAHAAIKGRSYRSNAEAHIDGRKAATLDIRRFYPSTAKSRVRNFFAEKLRCAPDVADLLTTLCCFNGSSANVIGLPTGSPLSPILALYANLPMFEAMNDYALRHQLLFTCYVDDLTFSGHELPSGLKRFVSATAHRFGHSLSQGKTHIYGDGRAKLITGVVIKDKQLKVPHRRFLKARAISKAIAGAPTPVEQLRLQRKLAGLLGEASFLDKRYTAWARQAQAEATTLNRQLSEKEHVQS